MKRINNCLAIGIFFNGISLISTRFYLLPDIVEGFCVGIGIAFIFKGMISSKYDISKFRNYKINFIKKVFEK